MLVVNSSVNIVVYTAKDFKFRHMPTISILGLLGNVLSVHILHSRHSGLDLHTSFTNLLICLAVFDSLFLVCANSVYAVSAIMWPAQSSTQMLAAPYIIPLTNMAMTGSVYTVVAITVKRYTTLKQTAKDKLKGSS